MRSRRSILRLLTGFALVGATLIVLPGCQCLFGQREPVRSDGPGGVDEDASRPTLFEIRRGQTYSSPLVAAVITADPQYLQGEMVFGPAMGMPQPADQWFTIGPLEELQPPMTGDLCERYASEIPNAMHGYFQNGVESVQNPQPCGN